MPPRLGHPVFTDLLEHATVRTGHARLTQALEHALQAAGLRLDARPRTTLVEADCVSGLSWWDLKGHDAGAGAVSVEVALRLTAQGAFAVHVLMYAWALNARQAHGLFDMLVLHVPGPAGWAPEHGPEAVLAAIEASELLGREDWSGAAEVVVHTALQALEP